MLKSGDSRTVPAQTQTFPIDPGNLRKIDDWIELVGRQWGTCSRTLFRARVCAAELATNVLEHGGSTPDRDHIIVILTRRDDGIEIEFLDTGSPFDPTRAVRLEPPTSLDAATINGRGLMLVRAYTTDFSYRHDGTYNRTVLRIEPKPCEATERKRSSPE